MSASAPAKAAPRPTPARPAGLWASVKKFLKPLASLQLTVTLLGLSIVLVFLGTVAQVDDSIHTVLNRYFYTWVAWVPLEVFVRFGQKFLGVSRDSHLAGSLPFPGGWILGFLLMFNLLAAHTVRFKLTWKRTGIWMIHLGIMVLLLGEFFSSQFKIESRMSIEEGNQSNFAELDGKVELAIIDQSDPKEDSVAVIPEQMLRRGGKISNPSLPVDVEVVRYMGNSVLLEQAPADNPATAGLGLQTGAEERKETTGVSPSQKVEIASAYVRFRDRADGHDLGIFFISRWLSRPQALEVGGKTYVVSLRGERRYLPFSLHLIQFRFDRFVGTSTARNYSSDVRLVDPERHEDRQLRIAMNEPLRHRGETFYQSSFDEETEKATVLQVVRNPAWTFPYFACFLVSSGMLVHFGIHLNGFLRRRAAS